MSTEPLMVPKIGNDSVDGTTGSDGTSSHFNSIRNSNSRRFRRRNVKIFTLSLYHNTMNIITNTKTINRQESDDVSYDGEQSGGGREEDE